MPGPFTGTPFPMYCRVRYNGEAGQVVAIGREPTTGQPNGWYMVEFQTHGTTTRLSCHHATLDSIPPARREQ